MNNRLSLLLIGCIFPFLSFYAQKNMNLPPYYPTVKGITDYAVWQLVYPDSLLKADIAGEAVCTLRIDSLVMSVINILKPLILCLPRRPKM